MLALLAVWTAAILIIFLLERVMLLPIFGK